MFKEFLASQLRWFAKNCFFYLICRINCLKSLTGIIFECYNFLCLWTWEGGGEVVNSLFPHLFIEHFQPIVHCCLFFFLYESFLSHYQILSCFQHCDVVVMKPDLNPNIFFSFQTQNFSARKSFVNLAEKRYQLQRPYFMANVLKRWPLLPRRTRSFSFVKRSSFLEHSS